MKTRLALGVFVILSIAYCVALWLSLPLLPERVATHFNASGQPNGWMTREGTVWFMGLFGVCVPWFMVLAFASPRWIPARFVNLPNRGYWLSDDNRQETLDWLGRAGVWLGCTVLLFMGATHALIVRANLTQPPRLELTSLLAVVGAFIVAEFIFVVRLLLRFAKTAP
ncbi:MAG: DUF1648 domain-containing protein [Roseimicrobium sp.]